jgi:hypothetical protein
MPVTELLIEQVAAHLTGELGDAATAAALARSLARDALSWRAPEVAPERIATVLAFTFGNRMHPNGNREPGPVNEALAAAATRLHRETGAQVFAQWEVAEAIGGRVAKDNLVAILPAPGRAGRAALSEHFWRRWRGGPARWQSGIAGRCVATARRFGLAGAAMPAGHAMPAEYDPLSGQPWCRSRLAYLLHDIAIRVAERRDAVIAARPGWCGIAQDQSSARRRFEVCGFD